jgi:hypothetical protein
MLPGLPEHRVALHGGSTKSHSDIWVLGKRDKQLVSIAIEGKVRESFGGTVAEWFESETLGKRVRLRFFTETLGLWEIPPAIRYQAFAALFGVDAELNRVHVGKKVGEVTLHLGCACGAAEYLRR